MSEKILDKYENKDKAEAMTYANHSIRIPYPKSRAP